MFIRSLHPCLAHKPSLLASVSNRVSILTNPIKQRKCILVSGGASGLGEAVTRHFVAQGLDVVVFDIHSERLESLQKELGSSQAPQHGSVLAFKVDITDANAVQEALNSCFPLTTPKEEESPMSSVPHPRVLTGLVNCAGICPAKKLYSSKSKSPVHPLDLFQRVLEVNTVGTFNLTRLGVQRMIEHPLQGAPTDSPRRLSRGVVVLTASIAADEGQVGQMAYAASKAAVQGMCLPLARELGSHRIRVMCVAPGVMHTPLVDGLPPAVQEQLSAHVPFPKRLGAPFEFAQLVHHIFENEYLNGSTIRLDGALRMPP